VRRHVKPLSKSLLSLSLSHSHAACRVIAEKDTNRRSGRLFPRGKRYDTISTYCPFNFAAEMSPSLDRTFSSPPLPFSLGPPHVHVNVHVHVLVHVLVHVHASSTFTSASTSAPCTASTPFSLPLSKYLDSPIPSYFPFSGIFDHRNVILADATCHGYDVLFGHSQGSSPASCHPVQLCLSTRVGILMPRLVSQMYIPLRNRLCSRIAPM
jgi:hypothetical protein